MDNCIFNWINDNGVLRCACFVEINEFFELSEAAFLGIGIFIALRWYHNGRNGVWNHQPSDCLLNRLFRGKSKKISQPRVTGLCTGNSPGASEFHAQMASNAENVSIWWRHHGRQQYWRGHTLEDVMTWKHFLRGIHLSPGSNVRTLVSSLSLCC